MNPKFSFRAIQQGQTQQSHVVNAGAGQNGQALVVRAAEGTRYQLADLLTLTSPKKLQLKRVGQDLLVALPGNDVTSPDIVIKDYFNFKDLSLSGLAASGEPMVYDTSSSFNIGQSATGITPESLAANKTTAATLATASGGWFDGGMGLAALGGGGLLLAAAADGGSDSTTNAGLTKITTYKGDTNKSVPTVTDFATAGVTGVDASNITGILSLFVRTQLPLDSAASLQTLVDSFKKIVAEANGTSADATTEDPSATDYVNLMGSNTPNSINTKPQALALLNDRLKALSTTDVDSYSEVKALADIVEILSVLTQTAASTTGTPATTGNLTVDQLSTPSTSTSQLGLGLDRSIVLAANLSAYADAIRASADDLSSLSTTAQLKALVEAYNTILAEANGTTADATTTNPSAADYAAIGADIGTAKTDTAALARLNAIVGNLASTAVDTVGEINKLAATLDKIQTVAALATGATLTDAQKFSADELKNLGLTGFTGSEAQNTALALKVSEAIRDKASAADVQADLATSTGSGIELKNGVKTAFKQTQLQRLEVLVSQEIINNYEVVDAPTAEKFTTIVPTLTDWKNIGVFKPNTLEATPDLSAAQGYSALSTTERDYLNSAADKLGTSAISTPAQAQAILEAYLRIVQEADGSSADTNNSLNPTAVDLGLVGVTGDVTDSSKEASKLMLDAIANLASTGVDTVAELQALATTTTGLMAEAAASTATGIFKVTDLTNLGLRGASTTGANANLTDFLEHVRASADDGTGVNTVAELQSFMSLAVVQAWARDVNPDLNATPQVKKTPVPGSTLDLSYGPNAQHYKDIGVVRTVSKKSNGDAGDAVATLSPADVNALNDAIDTLVDNSTSTATDDALVNTLAKVQGIATSYFKILNEANGSASDYTTGNTVQTTDGISTTQGYLNNATAANNVTGIDLNPNPTTTDYDRIGVQGFSISAVNPVGNATLDLNRTSLLNTLIAEKNFGQVDTVKEIQALATTVDKVLTLAGGSGLTLAEFTTDLSLSGVNDTNLAAINGKIQTKSDPEVDTFAELQSLVSLTRIERYADDSNTTTNSGGLPTQFDWHAVINLQNERDANISAYNSAADNSTSTALGGLGGLQGLVDAYNNILTAADGNRSTAPAWADTASALLDYGKVLGTSSAAYTKLTGTNATQIQQLMINANSGLTTDKLDTVTELSDIAFAAGRVVELAAVSDDVSTSQTGLGGSTNTAGVTKNDLTLLGLDTSKINNGSGNYDTYEMSNILAEIQNLSPSAVSDLATLQTKINQWALS